MVMVFVAANIPGTFGRPMKPMFGRAAPDLTGGATQPEIGFAAVPKEFRYRSPACITYCDMITPFGLALAASVAVTETTTDFGLDTTWVGNVTVGKLGIGSINWYI
jgi:hypothetical protein